MNSMYEWESSVIANETINIENENNAREILVKIFEKYCPPKKRKYGKPNNISYGFPSKYNMNNQYIYKIDNTDKKYLIYTKFTILGNLNYKYTLQYKNKKWLVDKREVSYDNGITWEKSIL